MFKLQPVDGGINRKDDYNYGVMLKMVLQFSLNSLSDICALV